MHNFQFALSVFLYENNEPACSLENSNYVYLHIIDIAKSNGISNNPLSITLQLVFNSFLDYESIALTLEKYVHITHVADQQGYFQITYSVRIDGKQTQLLGIGFQICTS